MAQLMNGFNPMDFDPSQGGGNWPLGKHPVIIESSEVKPTKDNTSGYLQLNLRIIEGPAAGHTGPYRLNLYNQSKDAADIAHKQLSAVCHVTQTFQLGQDGRQVAVLHNKPFVIEVGMQRGEEAAAKGYTEIKRVFDMAGNEPGKQGQAAPAQQPQGFGNQPAAQQQPQQQPQGGAQAWGGNQAQPQQQEQPQQGPAGGQPAWGGGQPAEQQQPAQQGGGWSQNQGGAGGAPAGQPAWGQR